VTKKKKVANEGLDVLAGKALEKRATIIVEANLITWESSNDLCTFYRGRIESG
jgi:hypothetical protein